MFYHCHAGVAVWSRQEGTGFGLDRWLLVTIKNKYIACTMPAELGWYTLIIKVKKRALKCYNHLKESNQDTLYNIALNHRENLQGGPLHQLALGVWAQTQARLPDRKPIGLNQIIRKLPDILERDNPKPKQNGMLSSTKKRIYIGTISEHGKWPKT